MSATSPSVALHIDLFDGRTLMLLRPRLRYIVKDGVMRRGSIVGGIASIVFAFDTCTREGARSLWHSLPFIVLCFCEWTIGSGWLIGSWLWLREARHVEGKED